VRIRGSNQVSAKSASRPAIPRRMPVKTPGMLNTLADQLLDLAAGGRRAAEVEVQERALQVVGERDEDQPVVAATRDSANFPSAIPFTVLPRRRSYVAATAAASRGATWLIACSVSAVMVRLGLTPMLAGIAEPSHTSRFS